MPDVPLINVRENMSEVCIINGQSFFIKKTFCKYKVFHIIKSFL